MRIVAFRGGRIRYVDVLYVLPRKDRVSLADAFAAATAKTTKATLVIGKDAEFDSIKKGALQIERIG